MASAASLDPGSLPHPRTSLIGRATERAAAHVSLLDDAVPLLTLTGPGGVGKTRLALAIARDVAEAFADGVVWVDLAPVTDPAAVSRTVATALGLPSETDAALAERLSYALHARQLLLLLDNSEHVLDAVAELVGLLLATCPALQVLATSRAALHLRSEQRVPVEPLPIPAADVDLTVMTTNEAVRLFSERSRAVRPAFALTADNAATVAALCRAVDGLPLAIELAAARSAMLSPEALLALMTDRLQLLRGQMHDLPPRQQTMAATIAWSYDLLDPVAQALFRRVAVFVGGFPLDGVLAVAVSLGDRQAILTHFEALVEQSLVQREIGDRLPRFTMLETIREFGVQQLREHGEERAARDTHAAFFIALSEGPPPAAIVQASQDVSLPQRIRIESDNIRVAMTHLIATRNGSQALRLALGTAWFAAATSQEGRRWLEWSLAHTPTDPSVSRGVALAELAYVRWAQGAYAEAQAYADVSRAIAERCHDATLAANAYDILGAIARSQQHHALARTHLTMALRFWRELEDAIREADALQMLAGSEFVLGDHGAATQHATEAMMLYRQQGDPRGLATGLGRIGQIARDQGNDADAVAAYREALTLCLEAKEQFILVGVFVNLAELASRHGQSEIAAILLGTIDRLAQEAGATRQPTAADIYERAFQAASTTLGRHHFTQLHAQGLHLSLTDAASLADRVRIPSSVPSDHDARVESVACIRLTDQTEERSTTIDLTPREQDILALLAQRLTNEEIAERLFIGRRTVDTHVGHLLEKLEASNRRQAVAIAAQLGLI